MKPSTTLPDFPTLPFDRRHHITDVVIEQLPDGAFLFDSARCTTGDGRIYRLAPSEAEVANVEIEGDVDTLLEWAFFFVTHMNKTLKEATNANNALRDRRLTFSYDLLDSKGRYQETLRFRVVKVKKLCAPDVFTRRSEAIATPWVWRYQMRRTPQEIPNLRELRYTNGLIHELLMRPEFNGSGIIGFGGKKFQGKSTAAIATVVARAQAFGNQFFTIENPPEFDASGWFGEGEVCQVFLDLDKPIEVAIEEGLRDVVQSFSTQTSGGGPGLFYGEASDPAMVASMLNNANDGTGVICTGHATSAASFAQHLLDVGGGPGMSRETARSAIASGLRLVVHQTLSITDNPAEGYWARGSINAQILYSPHHATKIAKAIRHDNTEELEEIARQQTEILDNALNGYLTIADGPRDRIDAYVSGVMKKLAEVVKT